MRLLYQTSLLVMSLVMATNILSASATTTSHHAQGGGKHHEAWKYFTFEKATVPEKKICKSLEKLCKAAGEPKVVVTHGKCVYKYGTGIKAYCTSEANHGNTFDIIDELAGKLDLTYASRKKRHRECENYMEGWCKRKSGGRKTLSGTKGTYK
ncbi:hypothetical protein FA10DRAFT_257542 [Acaromyces ingoldii]|uniref:Uncharacterized protein n=1 Tax=Acaromyces ingoldii TaxID=215250 RepID=A0A316YX10_9BASI|nr:hypothetical protein FA10DRAFT_257542 [Acaromyces ingoldii]PWN93198.1 hypothetical protein FA10DRAFT_257542 [Acaromyces ingoldii]